MKRLLILSALFTTSLSADPSRCMDPTICNDSVFEPTWQDNFYTLVGMEVSYNGDVGKLKCEGACSSTKNNDGFLIIDTKDGDTFQIDCNSCDVLHKQDGSVAIRNGSGFWEKVRLSLTTTGGGVTFPISN